MSIAEKFEIIADEVYKVGYEKGKAEGGDTETAYNEGLEAGKQAEYNEFWANFWKGIRYRNTSLINSNGYVYYGFNWFGAGWNKDNFKPIYPDEKVYVDTYGYRIMQFFNKDSQHKSELLDLTEFCQKVSFINCKYATSSFEDARAKNITVDFSNATTIANAFSCGYGGEFENILVKISAKCTTFTNILNLCKTITNFKFTDDSVVAADISFKHSEVLNKDSITSIINALSPTVSGKTVTFSQTAVNNAFETSTGNADGTTSTEWLNLIATKSNWTISLV